MDARSNIKPANVEEFLGGLPGRNLGATWEVLAQAVPVKPQPRAIPFHWAYEEVREQLFHAGDLVPAEQAERRTLCFCNPGLDGAPAATSTLFADIQLVLPGEVASTHRHTACAVRFMLEGEGSFAIAENEKISQVPGDLVIGPGWAWHSHGNEGNDDAVWFDCLDAPLAAQLDASFFSPYDTHAMEITKVVNASSRSYGNAGISPVWQRDAGTPSPLLKFPWADARPALDELPDNHLSPYDGAIIEYTHPLTGKSCMPTVSCTLQLIKAGSSTQPHRHTSNSVYLAVEGSGQIVIEGETFDWQRGDVIALPIWASHHHVNSSDRDGVLFCTSDAPLYQSLGYYREEDIQE